MAAAKKKSKITCFKCGAVYRLDLSRVPPERTELRCLKCKSPMPLLDRVLGGKKKKEPAPAQVAPQPQATGGPKQEDASAMNALLALGAETVTMDEPEDSGDSWLALYGDMMSILLIFFVLLFAMSNIDKNKFQSVMEAVSQALSGTVKYEKAPAMAVTEISGDHAAKTLSALKSKVAAEGMVMAGLERKLEQLIKEQGLEQRFTVENEPKGLVLIAQDMAMFDSGSAALKTHVLPTLKRVAAILKKNRNDIVVEGHTDNVPISTAEFASNWELSAKRAINVVHFLTETGGLSPARVSAAGYAFYRPRHDFSGADAAKNRRIEIVIVKRYGKAVTQELGGGERTGR